MVIHEIQGQIVIIGEMLLSSLNLFRHSLNVKQAPMANSKWGSLPLLQTQPFKTWETHI